MKRIALLAGLLFTQVAVADNSDMHLLGSSPEGGFIGLVGKSAQWKDEAATLVGVRTGWLIHDNVALGFEVQTLGNAVPSPDPEVKAISMTVYGLHAEGKLYDWRFLSLRTSLSIGSGSAGYRQTPATLAQTESAYRESSLRYSAADLNLVVHVNSDADMGFGYGVLKVTNAQIPGYSDDELSGGVVSLFLRKLL